MLQIAHISDLHWVDVKNASVVARGLRFLSAHVSKLATFYAYAEPRIYQGLKNDLPVAVNSQPTVVVLSGDISAWPGDSPNVVDGYYAHVDDVMNSLPVGSELLPVLGNHDWGTSISTAATMSLHLKSHHTIYSQTQFEVQHGITKPRYHVRRDIDVTAIFFLIESSTACVPATGMVTQATLDWLRNTFAQGRGGSLGHLTSDEYKKAVKILILHHSPLPLRQYSYTLSPATYRRLELINSDPLLRCCKNDVDMLLFGHTHVPVSCAYNGFVMINAGTTLSIQGSPFAANFHIIRILDYDTVEVETFYWFGIGFSSSGSKPISFKRGSASSALGYGSWS